MCKFERVQKDAEEARRNKSPKKRKGRGSSRKIKNVHGLKIIGLAYKWLGSQPLEPKGKTTEGGFGLDNYNGG